jgi:hypothetical protein
MHFHTHIGEVCGDCVRGGVEAVLGADAAAGSVTIGMSSAGVSIEIGKAETASLCSFAITTIIFTGERYDEVAFEFRLPIAAVLARFVTDEKFLEICEHAGGLSICQPLDRVLCDICEFVHRFFCGTPMDTVEWFECRQTNSMGLRKSDGGSVQIDNIWSGSVASLISIILGQLLFRGPPHWREWIMGRGHPHPRELNMSDTHADAVHIRLDGEPGSADNVRAACNTIASTVELNFENAVQHIQIDDNGDGTHVLRVWTIIKSAVAWVDAVFSFNINTVRIIDFLIGDQFAAGCGIISRLPTKQPLVPTVFAIVDFIYHAFYTNKPTESRMGPSVVKLGYGDRTEPEENRVAIDLSDVDTSSARLLQQGMVCKMLKGCERIATLL